MQFQSTKIPDVILIEPKVFSDDRGYFYESYTEKLFKENGIDQNFVQDNETLSSKGVIRGLHVQIAPAGQAKLIRVVEGEIFDVAVDLRKGSPTLGQYVGEILSSENKKMLYIPEGFAHGYCTLKDNTKVLYKVSGFYSPENERGMIWDDRTVQVSWPKLSGAYIISEKDKKLPTFKELRAL